MGNNAIAFIRALGLAEVDVLGFSIGGMVAQEITLQAPDLVRRLILVGTGPRGADMTNSKSAQIFSATYDPPEHKWLDVHFTPSVPSRAAGLEFLKRKQLRKENRDPEMSAQGIAAQGEAIGKYVAYGESGRECLKSIRQPTLIVQGSNDVIIPTMNSYTMQQLMPNAELIIYPDANHGSFYQYPELFVEQANHFLTWTQKASSVPLTDRLPFPALAPGKGENE
jgi:pimeloyl-ACP methyl ester carboxylesterase